jgi:hypothetical protein
VQRIGHKTVFSVSQAHNVVEEGGEWAEGGASGLEMGSTSGVDRWRAPVEGRKKAEDIWIGGRVAQTDETIS